MPKVKLVAKTFWAIMGPEKGKFALNYDGGIICAASKRDLTKRGYWRHTMRIVKARIEVLEIYPIKR